jgi:hypothetical protein
MDEQGVCQSSPRRTPQALSLPGESLGASTAPGIRTLRPGRTCGPGMPRVTTPSSSSHCPACSQHLRFHGRVAADFRSCTSRRQSSIPLGLSRDTRVRAPRGAAATAPPGYGWCGRSALPPRHTSTDSHRIEVDLHAPGLPWPRHVLDPHGQDVPARSGVSHSSSASCGAVSRPRRTSSSEGRPEQLVGLLRECEQNAEGEKYLREGITGRAKETARHTSCSVSARKMRSGRWEKTKDGR